MKHDNDSLPVVIAFGCGVIFLLIAFTLIHFSQAATTVDNTSGQFVHRAACDLPLPNKHDVTQTRYEDGTVIVVRNTPVYLMKVGTVGKLCMRYTELFAGQSYSGKVYSQVANAADTKNVTITPLPDNITEEDYYFANAIDALENKYSFDIVYDISAPLDSKGFYGVWPLGVCPGLPFAIGYDASEIDYSLDFQWEAGPYYGCSGLGMDEKIVGVSGIDLVYITNQSKSNIGYEITGVHTNVTLTEPQPRTQINGSIIINQTATSAVAVTFTVHFHAYNGTFNVIANARDFEIAHFNRNPQFEKVGQCSWDPTNDASLGLTDARSIYDEKFGHDSRYVKIDSTSAKILPYTTDSTYSFNIMLTDLPEGYYALQPSIFIADDNEPVDQFGINTNDAGTAIADYFPATIGTLPSPMRDSEQGNEFSSTLGGLYGKC